MNPQHKKIAEMLKERIQSYKEEGLRRAVSALEGTARDIADILEAEDEKNKYICRHPECECEKGEEPFNRIQFEKTARGEE